MASILSGVGAATVGELSISEAEQLVRVEAEAKQSERETRKEALLAVPAEAEWEADTGERKVIFRRITPPVIKVVPVKAASVAEPQFSPEMQARSLADQLRHENISLYATVYDRQVSEVVWQKGDDRFTVWTNIDFNLLRQVGFIDAGDVHYSYFGMTENISSEDEARLAELAAANGWNLSRETRWKPCPVAFADESPEYVVLADSEADVPAELFSQMDALLDYFIENKAQLEAAYKRAAILNAAREKYLAERPPEPKQDVIINFYPLSERKTVDRP